MKKKLYGIASVIGFVLMAATGGGIMTDMYEMSVGLWQLGWGFALFMFGWYGLWLEEERAARRR